MRHVLITFMLMVLAVSGCGTVMHGRTQEIPLSSSPSNVKVTSSGGDSCVCPCTLTLNRSKRHIIVATLDGYDTQQMTLKPRPSGAVWLNVIFWPGAIVDTITESCGTLEPKFVHFNMLPAVKKK